MTIDRPSPDILIFDPPPQSIKRFRTVHRLATAFAIIYLATVFILLLLESVLLLYLIFRYKMYGMAEIYTPIVWGLVAISTSVLNSLAVHLLFKIKKPVLVQSCIFDRDAGELSIQHYSLFARHLKTIKIPLNKIVDVQVRHYPILSADDFSAISLMTKQSSKPVYLFQKSSRNKISTFTMRLLLEEVATIRKFLNLPSEPPYMVNHLPWYKILSATPISNELIESVEQNNDQLIYNLQSRQLWQKVTWKFNTITQIIEIKSQNLIGSRSKCITRSEIKSIAIKTEFLPLEVSVHQFIRSAHRRQYQKQYSAILISSDQAQLKPQHGYWRIFTSTDLTLVCDLVDRVQAHFNLPLDELISTESIESEPVSSKA